MKYCPFCGAGLDEGFAFCPKCGKPFEGEKENPNLVGKCVSQEGFAPAADALLSAAEDTSKKKKRGGLIAIIAAVVVLAFVGGMLAAGAFGQKRKAAIPFSDDTEAIAQASKSVVMLTCYDKEGEPCATGSGFVVFDDDIIVTNYHVIEQDTYRVKAQVEGGISFDCPTVLAYDAEKDIAILKADRKTDVALLSAGSANNLQKGEKVVAIGSPLGLINSVSTGVFSGYIDNKAGSVLQFTAAISHGSSGGALFNDAGEVIGILGADTPGAARSAMEAALSALKNLGFAESGGVNYLAHTVSSAGSFLSREAGVPLGSALAYLIAPPLESLYGLDAALKAADVKLCVFYGPPSQTNFGGGLLTGTQSACEAACQAFRQAVEEVARFPK